MADARIARLTHARDLGPHTRLLEFALADDAPLGFVGGQYVIVNTGVPLPGGKVAKRAYSILSTDAEQQRFQIAVKRVGTGPGSNFMHALSEGAELPFSGPWGKSVVGPDPEPGSTLVLASDTGLTAALGLVRGRPFRPLAADARLVWLVPHDDEFLPQTMVESLLPDDIAPLIRVDVPPVHDPARVAAARDALRAHTVAAPDAHIFLSGDGAILYPIRQDLIEAGVPEDRIRLECFFNNPQRKAP